MLSGKIYSKAQKAVEDNKEQWFEEYACPQRNNSRGKIK